MTTTTHSLLLAQMGCSMEGGGKPGCGEWGCQVLGSWGSSIGMTVQSPHCHLSENLFSGNSRQWHHIQNFSKDSEKTHGIQSILEWRNMSTLEPQNKTKHANSKIPRLQTLERDLQILTCRSRKYSWFIQIFATVLAFLPSQFAYCVGFCKIFEIVGGLVNPCYTIVWEIALRVSTFFIRYQSARFCEICSFVSISDSCLICSCICSPRYMESSELARNFLGDSL